MDLFRKGFGGLLGLIFWGAIFPYGMASAAEIRVVASIPPIHSLVAGVMDGIGVPHLLVRGGASPHAYALRPSGARALSQADLIIWVGEGLESFLPKALSSLGNRADIIELTEDPQVQLLDARDAGVWASHDHHADAHGGKNPHIWLNPVNAKAIVTVVADALIKHDVENTEVYSANAARIAEQIDQLADEIRARLMPVAKEPFVLFHDSFRYFEEAFGLNPVGAIAVNPDRIPGARRLAELRREVGRKRVKCVFREPQFTPKLAVMIAEGTGARIGVIDPLGAELEPGPDLYDRMMRSNAESLLACLLGK